MFSLSAIFFLRTLENNEYSVLISCTPKKEVKRFWRDWKEETRKKKKKKINELHLSESFCVSVFLLGTFGSVGRCALSSLMLFVKEHLPYLFLVILLFCSSSFMADTQTR